MLEKSAIVACHPDDEILWFSSIIEEAEKVVICLLEAPQFPHLAPGRLRVKEQYPLKTLSWLGVRGSEAGGKADWGQIKATQSGVDLPLRTNPGEYERSFREIQEGLERELWGVKNVFTHNPWGDYGHEEHVQVYRAVESLKAKMGFQVWFSNYCSNKSLAFMLGHVSGFNSSYVRRPTRLELSEQIKRLFIEQGCWTWFDDWKPFQDECFMNSADLPREGPKVSGHLFPLNMINFI